MPRALNSKEETLADLLHEAGLSRPAARCLVCLVRGGEWTSPALADGAGLSQPGVSQGMRELLQMDLTRRAVRRHGGKGRPAHLYSLNGSAEEVLRSVERAKRQELMEELAVLDALRDQIKRFLG